VQAEQVGEDRAAGAGGEVEEGGAAVGLGVDAEGPEPFAEPDRGDGAAMPGTGTSWRPSRMSISVPERVTWLVVMTASCKVISSEGQNRADSPPSTVITWPVVYVFEPLASQTATSAISAGPAARPIGSLPSRR
jgi:hypothetical protein